MEQTYSLSQSPRRLSERRGKPELQPLDPFLPSQINVRSRTTTDADIESSDSSVPSGVFSPENYATPAMSAPATPTDASPVRSLQAFGISGSLIVGSSIQEEEESNCALCGEYGLGLAVGAAGTMGTKDVAFPRLDIISTVREGFEGPCCGTHYHFNEKLAPVAMPPTPPSNSGERPYMYSTETSPTSPAIDAEVFSSGSPTFPQSPKSEAGTAGRSRAATILNKVVPAKLRASLKRRMSGANENASQPPPLPAVNTMPAFPPVSAPDTPPEEIFGRCFVKPPTSSATAVDNFSPHSSPETILPPTMLLPASPRSPTTEHESYLGSPLQSPRTTGVSSFTRMESLPETSYFALYNELVSSPLHPPTISPLMSPTLSATSQTSLNASGAPLHTHKKAPSIDPATSSAPQKPAAPLMLVTANSLADMIEEMQGDLAAYDATLERMKSSGWSSPQEIRNVELQREQQQRTWEARVAESKRILQGMRRTEVKDYAMSSVSI